MNPRASRAATPTLAAFIAITALAALSVSACSAGFGRTAAASRGGIHKIKHVVVIMQENRSFDNYFGTFPGADGIPMRSGVPTVCVPDPKRRSCVRPFHDTADLNHGGPHGAPQATADIDGGKMDGFVAQAESGRTGCKYTQDPVCSIGSGPPDVMGYHNGSDIPNYWAYARSFVLQDHMFEPNASWSLPQHLFMVSEWSAHCATHDPASCRNNDGNPGSIPTPGSSSPPPIFAWTDLTYLLYRHHVSWAYYLKTGEQPDCEDGAAVACPPVKQNARTPGIWNPLPYFDTVKADHQEGNIQDLSNFYPAASAGRCPPCRGSCPPRS